MIREFNDEPSVQFVREQSVQHAIALIQKFSGVSILMIDEAAIRRAVRLGIAPSAIARQWMQSHASRSN